MLPKSAAPEAVKVDMCGRAAVIWLRGNLDVTVIPVLSDKLASLAASRPEHVVLDMSAANVVDRAAAAVIVHAARSALPPGRKPVIGSPTPAVRRMLELTGLAAHCRLSEAPTRVRPYLRASDVSRSADHGRPATGGKAAAADLRPRSCAARSAAGAARDRARQLQEQAQQVLARSEALYPVIEVALADRLLSRPPAGRQHLLRRSPYARLMAQLATMPVIEQAKGIIMAQQRAEPDAAFDLLRRASQDMNVPVRELAAQIVAKTAGGSAKPSGGGRAVSSTPSAPDRAKPPR